MTAKKTSGERRREILEAALKCYAQKGYHATTMDDIARESGLTKGGIYWHFKSKWAIFIDIIREHKKVHKQLWKKLDKMGINEETLTKGGLLFLREHIENNWTSQICSEIELEATRNREILKEYKELHADIFKEIENKLIEAHKAGRIKKINFKNLALIIFMTIDGLAKYKKIYGNELNYEEIWNNFGEMIMRGILIEEE